MLQILCGVYIEGVFFRYGFSTDHFRWITSSVYNVPLQSIVNWCIEPWLTMRCFLEYIYYALSGWLPAAEALMCLNSWKLFRTDIITGWKIEEACSICTRLSVHRRVIEGSLDKHLIVSRKSCAKYGKEPQLKPVRKMSYSCLWVILENNKENCCQTSRLSHFSIVLSIYYLLI